MAALLTGLVSSTLYAQRTRQDSLSLEKLAASVAPFFASAQTEALSAELTDAASDLGGRLLVIDMDEKVQFDTFALLEGTRLSISEVRRVLAGGDSHAYAIKEVAGLVSDGEKAEYAALCAARMEVNGQVLGALVLLTPVTELHGAIQAVEGQLLTVFLWVAVAAGVAALIFAVTLTRPIKALTATIRRMGKGDLSARVQVRASGEMKELADSYNAMAEKIENFDKSRSQFVSNASHELKTPLATMKLLLQNLLLDPEMPQDIRVEFMTDMDHEIDRLTGIISDLLTLTQMDSHEGSLHLTDIDLSALAEETLHGLLPVAESRSQTVVRDIAPGIHLTGDATKLTQVLYNLADNALKYTPEGGRIAVTLHASGKEAVLAVTDNGIGIPKNDQAHVFDRFYRVDKARSRATGGTGLGLSIVRQMVQLHGGAITLDSSPGEGSTFTVTLPLRKEGLPCEGR